MQRMSIKKSAGYLILAASLLCLCGCASRKVDEMTKNEDVICGGTTDTSDLNAPKEIKSDNLTSLSMGFYHEDKFDSSKGRYYTFYLTEDENGKLRLKDNSASTGYEVDEVVLDDAQAIIKKYELAKSNGIHKITAGLAPCYAECFFEAEYDSGESISFSVNSDPCAKWSGAFVDYFGSIFAKNGDEKYLVSKIDGTIKRFCFNLQEDGKLYSCDSIRVPISGVTRSFEEVASGDLPDSEYETKLNINVYDLEKDEEERNVYSYPTKEYYEGILEIVSDMEIRDFENYNSSSDFDDAQSSAEYYEFYIEFEDGKRISGASNEPEDFDNFKPIANRITEYLEDYFNTHKDDSNMSSSDENQMQTVVNTEGRYAYNKDVCAGVINRDYLTLGADDVTKYPKLRMALDKLNKKIRDEYKSDIDEFIETAQGYDDMMTAKLGKSYDHEGCYDTSTVYVMRADDEYLSFVIVKDVYWGGNRAYQMFEGHTFDSKTGEELLLKDVVKNDAELDDALWNLLFEKYGTQSFGGSLAAKYKSGKRDKVLYETKNPEYLKWCLSPTGIDVFFDNNELNMKNDIGAYVQMSFDKYPKILNVDFKKTTGQYMVPLFDEGLYYADIDGNKTQEGIEVIKKAQNNDDYSSKYGRYSVSVGGKEYSDFAKYPFDMITPYYVHKIDGEYLYIDMLGDMGRRVDAIKFTKDGPAFVKWLPTDRFSATSLEPVGEDFKYVYKPLTNPSLADATPSFEDLFCGNYVGKEDESGEEFDVHYEISCIDGVCYLNYLSDYSYGAKEIELLGKPINYGDDWYQMVKMHSFSGFAFAGDYLDGVDGKVCCLQTGQNCDLLISPGLEDDAITLQCENGYNMYPAVKEATKNNVLPPLCGAWRSTSKAGKDNCEIFVEFFEDGRCDAVLKCEGYPPHVERGSYKLKDSNGVISASVVANVLGYAQEPSEWEFAVDNNDYSIMPDDSLYDFLPKPIDDKSMSKFKRTEPGSHQIAIKAGPAGRLGELKEMWEEYSSVPVREYDVNSAESKKIINNFKSSIPADYCDVLTVEDCNEKGIMWLHGYDKVKDGNSTITVDKDYAYYDLESGEFFYLFGAAWE